MNKVNNHLKDSGYGVDHTLFRNGMVSDRKAIDDLTSFLQNYNDYEHPTSRSHHANIKSDDRYETVYQMNMIQACLIHCQGNLFLNDKQHGKFR